MAKDLFSQSLGYLGVEPPKTILVEKEVEEIPETVNPDVIYLGKGKVYKDPEEAYNYLCSVPEETLPSGYRNSLSKSFLKIDELGQINNLYKDWKKYRKGVLPKIALFFKLAKESKEHSVCKRYISFLIQNKTPKEIDTYTENKVDLSYFKFYVLFKFFTTNRSV